MALFAALMFRMNSSCFCLQPPDWGLPGRAEDEEEEAAAAAAAAAGLPAARPEVLTKDSISVPLTL